MDSNRGLVLAPLIYCCRFDFNALPPSIYFVAFVRFSSVISNKVNKYVAVGDQLS